RTVRRVASRFSGSIQMRLADDRVDADRGLARGAVADDQLTLTTADRNHRVDRHDAGLHRLADRPAADNARRKFLDRIRNSAGDGALVVERLAKRVDDTPEQSFADGHLQQFSRSADFAAFLETSVVTED